MELKLISKEKDSMEIEIEGAESTILNPLINELLKNKAVVDTKYFTGHPQLDKVKLSIKVKEGKPQTALKRAARALAEQFEECKKLLEKAI